MRWQDDPRGYTWEAGDRYKGKLTIPRFLKELLQS